MLLECIQLLLAHGAPVKCKNIQGWSPLAEAISYGDRQTSNIIIIITTIIILLIIDFSILCFLFHLLIVTSLLRKLKKQSREMMEQRRPNLIQALNEIGNFKMELKWDFQSWGT